MVANCSELSSWLAAIQGCLPRVGAGDAEHIQQLRTGLLVRKRRSRTFSLGGPENLAGAEENPRHTLQECGGFADSWCLDDCDILCHPLLVLPFFQAFDIANAEVGAQRNWLKTKDVARQHATVNAAEARHWELLWAHTPQWSRTSKQRQMLSARCMNESSCVRTRRPSSLGFVKACVTAESATD